MRSNTPLASGDLNGCWLSKLVLTAETAGAIHLDDEQIPGEMLQKLGVGAAKWFRGEGTAEEGATRYLQMNMIEKRAVQFAFPRSIFITFNGSEYRSLFPDRMPVFYMYSLRRGMSVKPWFLPAPQGAVVQPLAMVD
jgi:L-tyrosine isonitrile synthase